MSRRQAHVDDVIPKGLPPKHKSISSRPSIPYRSIRLPTASGGVLRGLGLARAEAAPYPAGRCAKGIYGSKESPQEFGTQYEI